MKTLNTSDFIEIICRVSLIMDENEEYLTDLDAAIGDADHGINMNRGFKSVVEQLKKTDPDSDVGDVLMTTGTVLMETVGGAAGPLYGMMFTGMASAASDKKEVNTADLAAIFIEGLKAVQDIGGGTMPGDKTMVDTLYPAVQEFNKSRDISCASLVSVLERALMAADRGLKSTIPLIAKKGRASYLGERAVGHQDPGATSAYLIIKVIYDFAREKGE